jgi:hypothetical protein
MLLFINLMSTNDVNLSITLNRQKGLKTIRSQTNSSTTTTKTYQSNISSCNGEKLFSISKVPRKVSKVEQEDELSEDSVKLNPNSLISISKEVLRYLQDTRTTKGTDVTKYILLQLGVKEDDLSFKNIQRRVYDAINVMNAIGILHKDKNSLFYKGHSSFKKMFYKTGVQSRNSVLKDKLQYKADRINTKQHELMALTLKVSFEFIYLVLLK